MGLTAIDFKAVTSMYLAPSGKKRLMLYPHAIENSRKTCLSKTGFFLIFKTFKTMILLL